MNKNYIVVLLFLTAAFSLFLLKDKLFVKEEKKDETALFLEEMVLNSGSVSVVQEKEVSWNVRKESGMETVRLNGKGFELKAVTDNQHKAVLSFLSQKGFKKDFYNLAAGTVSELTGYRKDFVVCTVTSGFMGYKQAVGQWIPPDTSKKDVDVKCATASEEINHFDSKTEAVQNLFAIKHNVKSSQVVVWIKQETEDHLSGSFEISSEAKEGTFLAARRENVWQLVFDGSGTILCQKVDEYNFPSDMVRECVDEQGKIKIR